ncbi:hypothetical protein IW245_000061 [Longispora fulva]|uniref:Uncharacterized protein n=1 Tax=Longispora fulva TaxID=619741 RepID=A0A8J7GCD6_9ACTN|nr:hypothetical protein [Longispora fulva]
MSLGPTNPGRSTPTGGFTGGSFQITGDHGLRTAARWRKMFS